MTLMQLSETKLELTTVTEQRDEWKAKFIQQNKDLGCEMMDPNGTIWDYAKKLQTQLPTITKQRNESYIKIEDLNYELTAVTAQRDALAESLWNMLNQEHGAAIKAGILLRSLGLQPLNQPTEP